MRHGAARAIVEGRFTDLDVVDDALGELGAELDAGELLVARQISAQGRSRAFIGGAQSPISRLAVLTGELATIHGQSEQLRLGNPERQREVLDRSGGPKLAAVLARYRTAYRTREELRIERDDLVRNARERAREADLLRFGLDEIAGVDPQPGEDAALAAEAARLQAIDDLRMLAARASHALSGSDEGDLDDQGAVGLVGIARHALAEVARLDDGAADLAVAVGLLAGQLNDLAADVSSTERSGRRPAAVGDDHRAPGRLAALTHKYGSRARVLAGRRSRRPLRQLSGVTSDWPGWGTRRARLAVGRH